MTIKDMDGIEYDCWERTHLDGRTYFVHQIVAGQEEKLNRLEESKLAKMVGGFCLKTMYATASKAIGYSIPIKEPPHLRLVVNENYEKDKKDMARAAVNQ